MHLDRQINLEKIRIKKLISLFEPLYSTSKTVDIKSMYGEYLNTLKNKLVELEQTNLVKVVNN